MRLRPEALARATAIAGKVRITTNDARFPQIDIPVTGAIPGSAESGIRDVRRRVGRVSPPDAGAHYLLIAINADAASRR
jgi:hypothetical protein